MKFIMAEVQVRKGHFSNPDLGKNPTQSKTGGERHSVHLLSPLWELSSPRRLVHHVPACTRRTQRRWSWHFWEEAAAIYSECSSRCRLPQTSQPLVFAVIDLHCADYTNSCFLLISTPLASPMIKMHLSIRQLLSNGRTVKQLRGL